MTDPANDYRHRSLLQLLLRVLVGVFKWVLIGVSEGVDRIDCVSARVLIHVLIGCVDNLYFYIFYNVESQ